jgi:hypothetical protein
MLTKNGSKSVQFYGVTAQGSQEAQRTCSWDQTMNYRRQIAYRLETIHSQGVDAIHAATLEVLAERVVTLGEKIPSTKGREWE